MKTADLIGPALDWAVAKVEDDIPSDALAIYSTWRPRKFSIDWSQGGPIIERECICLCHYQSDEVGQPCEPGWGAYIHADSEYSYGPTSLIAAMRCYVTSKLGDEVDVPKELL